MDPGWTVQPAYMTDVVVQAQNAKIIKKNAHERNIQSHSHSQ